jgi:hypothetical protein
VWSFNPPAFSFLFLSLCLKIIASVSFIYPI